MISLVVFRFAVGSLSAEETSGYGLMSALNFYAVVTMLKGAGAAVDPTYLAGVEQMFDASIMALDQRGYAPRNGDSDWVTPWASSSMQAIAHDFNRSDWNYVLSQGQAGIAPPSFSQVFPWGGQAILRSGFAAEDEWIFFDVGPVSLVPWLWRNGLLAYHLRLCRAHRRPVWLEWPCTSGQAAPVAASFW